MERKDLKAGIYTRVSTEEQMIARGGISLEVQESIARKYCDLYEIPIIEYYCDKAISGKNTQRIGYQQAIKDLQNKKINAIIVSKLDRLSRSIYDTLDFIKKAEEQGWVLISVSENLDSTSPMGRMMMGLLSAMANFEREKTIERIVEVMDYKAIEQHRTVSKPPYGYHINKDKKIVQTAKEAIVVKTIFAQAISGLAPCRIAEQNNMSNVTVIARIHNPAYYGAYQHKNKLIEGIIIEPIIPKEEWDKTQIEIKKWSKARHLPVSTNPTHVAPC